MRTWAPPGGRSALRAAMLVCVASLVCGAVLTALVWTLLADDDRDAVVGALSGQAPAIVVTALVLAGGLGVLAGGLVARYSGTLRILGADLRLMEANPDHPVVRGGPVEVRRVAAAAESLAERRRVAEREVEAQVSSAAARLTAERNRLAALMSQLAVAVVVCNADGRVLLYNSAARAIVDDPSALGIGRSVYGTIDRGLVDHALDRIRAGHISATTGTAILGDRVLQVRVAVVTGEHAQATGFLFSLEDVTERTAAEWQRLALLREVTEQIRRTLGTLGPAAELLLEAAAEAGDASASGPELAGVVADQARRLGDHVERWEADPVPFTTADHPLAEVAAGDLVDLVEKAAARLLPVPLRVVRPDEPRSLRAEGYALTQGVIHLAGRLAERAGPDGLRLTLCARDQWARLELTWRGPPVTTAELDDWAAEPVAGGSVPSVAQTVVRHGGGLWPEVGAGGSPTVVLMLPIADRGPAGQAPAGRVVAGSGTESRPEFYDFDLFERREPTGDWTHALLSELAYTVFDTETTGLLPTEGDEVVAIGAVRVVNGRLLRQESFERLVDPRRSVPEVSTAVHGLTRDMLRGRPTIEVVLPEFARYAADTVLVGHNVGFDLQFLRVKEQATGVRLRQPVLDTLLLDAVASPEHERRSLEAIATRCGIEVVDRHSALGDAVVTAEVLLRLVTLLERQGVRTLGDALTASRATMQARLDQRMYGA